MNKITITLIIFSLLIFSSASSANAAFFSGKDMITPDSSFSFLQTWKESIQTFFTFGLENKAKQYLHLADVRLNEYKNMIEQGKTDIAVNVLEKYQKQLNYALDKVKELQDKGKDAKDLSQKIEEAVSRHLEVLQENLQKVPEQARKGIENAIENSRKGAENVLGKKIEKEDKTAGWQTYRNEEIGIEFKYPANLSKINVTKLDSINSPKFIFKGKAIIVEMNFIKEKENITITTPFNFSAYTADYDSNQLFFPFEENNNIISICPNPLVYEEDGNVCRIIDIAGEKAVWENFFLPRYEGLSIIQTRILLENKTSSIYKRLEFKLSHPEIEEALDEISKEVLEEEMKEVDAEALRYSKNIIEKKNLSEGLMENLNLLDQILSTFKFIQ